MLEVQSKRPPKPLPLLNIKKRNRNSIEDFEVGDFKIENYDPWPKIHMEMSA